MCDEKNTTKQNGLIYRIRKQLLSLPKGVAKGVFGLIALLIGIPLIILIILIGYSLPIFIISFILKYWFLIILAFIAITFLITFLILCIKHTLRILSKCIHEFPIVSSILVGIALGGIVLLITYICFFT